jgi:glucose/arabinose dehydrogenase
MSNMKKLLFSIPLLALSLSACAQQTESSVKAEEPANLKYTTEVVVSDIPIAWGLEFLPDGSMLIAEKAGDLIHFKNGVKTKIEGMPEVYNRGQGGLLDVKLHPDYANNGWIYISYASSEGEGSGGNTAIMRAKLNGNTLTNQEVLYKAEPNTTRGQHFGSRIVFDNDGYLFFSIGERGDHFVNPQDLTRDNGKVYRLHDDGKIPTDNPFVNTPNAKKAIYSYGHRNPQGMIVHPTTGEIWTHEHGPQGGDEINIIKPAKNYGWPVISYGINYDNTIITELTAKEGMEQPLFYWVPSIAPSGLAIVTSDKYPDWKDNLLVGSLKFGYVERLIIENNKVVKREKLFEGVGRVRNVKQAPDGFIYLGVEGKGIVKVIPN